MSIFQQHYLLRGLKSFVQHTLIKPGTTVPIIWGPLKGCRYIVNENSGWATIYGGWEPEAQKVYCKLIFGGDVIYDLGANTGIHSLLFSKLTGASGKVIAFEPLAENVREIESLVDLNNVTNLEIIEKAISNSCGTSTLKFGAHNKQGSLVGIGCEVGREVHVPIVTLDSLIQQGLNAPDFVKIDIEGAESDALEGMANSIEQCYPTFAIDLHTPDQDLKVGRYLKDHSYEVYRLNCSTSRRVSNQKTLLRKINNLDAGWGTPDGIWGTVFAIHPSRANQHIVDYGSRIQHHRW